VGEERKLYKILVVNPEGKKEPVGRPRRRWEDGIRMDIREIGWGCVNWIKLTQDRYWRRAVMNAVTKLRFLRHGVSYIVV
jgi:hypothetical protein